MSKRTKIDWERTNIKLVPVDRDHPNERNPYAKISAKEREHAIVSLCWRIWARHINEVAH